MNKNSKIDKVVTVLPATIKQQLQMDLKIEKQVHRDGIDMGVLSDGTAFLSGRGLARLCGVHHSATTEILSDWNVSPQKPRISKIKEILATHNSAYETPVIGPMLIAGAMGFAWTESICLAILEYYALDAQQNNSDIARRNYRLLAGKGLHDLIYKEVGYDPSHQIPEHWRVFHDRVSLTYSSLPPGYFGIFKEIADMIVHLGQNGIHIDSSFVPDISVGILWSKYWVDSNFDNKWGTRKKFEHNYPSYFAQAVSNPQLPWCYPESALGEFRKWFREVYIGDGKFSNYLATAVQKKSLPASFAQLALAAYIPSVFPPSAEG